MGKKVQNDNEDDVEEVFTDLRGNPDPADADPLDKLDAAPRRKGNVQPDDDLIPDEDEDDADPLNMDAGGDEDDADPVEDDEDPEPDEGDEPVIEEPIGEDPKDRALRQRTLDLLDERAQRLIEQHAIADAAIKNGEKAMTAATARLKTAKEAGDTDGEIAAMGEWSEARDSIAQAKTALSFIDQKRGKLKSDLDEIGFDAKTGKLLDVTPRASGTGKLTPNATKFLTANEKWLKDPKHKAKADYLYAIDSALGSEAKWKDKKNDPAYFAELGRRFNRDNPGFVRGVDGKLIASAQRTRGNGSPTGSMGSAGVNRDTAGNQRRGGKVKFEESDKREMRKFGLDPGKKSHRANWLREKAAVNTQSSGRA